jgi:hypothetical protein
VNATAAKRIAFAMLVAPALAAIGIGLAYAAENSAQQTMKTSSGQGMSVDISSNNPRPLTKCSIISTPQDRHRYHGGGYAEQYNAAHIDALCPSAS